MAASRRSSTACATRSKAPPGSRALDEQEVIEQLPASGPFPSRVLSRVPALVAERTVLDGADHLALRTARGILLGAALGGGPRSLWCRLRPDHAFGFALSTLCRVAGIERLSTPAPGPLHPGRKIPVPHSWGVDQRPAVIGEMHALMERAAEIRGVVLAVDGEPVCGALRDRVDATRMSNLVRRRAPVLDVALPADAHVVGSVLEELGGARPSMVTGEAELWCFGARLSDEQTLWIFTDRETAQGLGWAYLTSPLARAGSRLRGRSGSRARSSWWNRLTFRVMCGIVGYVGPKECASILVEGLRRLEYRGYDSAGLAIQQGPGKPVQVLRAVGKLANLDAALRETPLKGTTGIGHTRWATHGRPSERNAHPHVSGDVAVVHNGIIENHLLLRRELTAAGVHFSSDTDTEIVAHLINGALKKGAANLEGRGPRVARRLEGAYAIAVVSASAPDEIIVAKHDSPLVLGVGNGESFCASDIPALLAHTRDVILLLDGEMAVLRASGITLSTVKGEPVTRAPKRIDWSPTQAEKGGYKHFMLKEIHEQPRSVEDTLRGRIDLAAGRHRGRGDGRLRRSWPRRSTAFTSSPAAPARTPPWRVATGWSRSRASPRSSRSAARCATASRSSPPATWSSR